MEGEETPMLSKAKSDSENLLGVQIRKWPPDTLKSCIISVPEVHNNANKEAFTPRAVSIGPLYYGSKHLEGMESNKVTYLQNFVDHYAADLDYYYEKAKKWEVKARALYKNKISLDSDQFVKMIVKDGIFIIVHFLRMIFYERNNSDDDKLNSQSLKSDVLRDLILIENQLPFFVLKELYSFFNKDLPWNDFLCGLATEYLKTGVNITKVRAALVAHNIKHLVHFLQLLCVISIPRELNVPSRRPKIELSRSASKLHEAGVKFVRAESYLPFDLNFNEEELPVCFGRSMVGVFRFPPLNVTGWTESFFRNLIAHEQCHHSTRKVISSYVLLMSFLIHEPKDVDLLINCKIIEHSLSSSDEVCTLFNNLFKRSMMDDNDFYYMPLCERLNAFSAQQLKQWRAACYKGYMMFKDTHCTTPCTIISFIVGIILLALTITGSLYGFLSKK